MGTAVDSGMLKQSDPKRGLQGEVSLPGDKSITHRTAMFAALARGESDVCTTELGRDNFATLRIMRQLGASMQLELVPNLLAIAAAEGFPDAQASTSGTSRIIVSSEGIHSLRAPADALDCGNSGTTARLLCGILAGQPYAATLVGDASLSKRPFQRVTGPLSEMGAKFSGDMLPLTVTGGTLQAINYTSPKSSAQVKSAIMLAGLQANGTTVVTEPRVSRDHSERMLSAMGVPVVREFLPDGSHRVTVNSLAGDLKPLHGEVPGDFSSAAFLLVAGSILPDSKILIRSVGWNSTRTGLYDLLVRMGANIQILSKREQSGEDVADVEVTSAPLRGIQVTADDVVLAIDEIPILCVAAAFATGETHISGAQELRVKESDRLAMMALMLSDFGVTVEEFPDGLRIEGNPGLLSGPGGEPNFGKRPWQGSGDHRIAMSAAILELAMRRECRVSDRHAIETSFPTFVSMFQTLLGCHEV